jgi:hypothetical protein
MIQALYISSENDKSVLDVHTAHDNVVIMSDAPHGTATSYNKQSVSIR